MNNNILPLGSVVLLNNAKRYLVVIGYAIVEDGGNKIYDYLGCPYPIGVIASDANLLFNKEEIAKVIFTGFSNVEGDNFRSELENNLRSIKNG